MTEPTVIAVITVLSTSVVGCIPIVYKLWTKLSDQHTTTTTKINEVANIVSDVQGVLGNIDRNIKLKLMNDGHDMSGHDISGHDMSGHNMSGHNMSGHDMYGQPYNTPVASPTMVPVKVQYM